MFKTLQTSNKINQFLIKEIFMIMLLQEKKLNSSMLIIFINLQKKNYTFLLPIP